MRIALTSFVVLMGLMISVAATAGHHEAAAGEGTEAADEMPPVMGLHQPGENFLEPIVVADGREVGGVGGERQGRKGPALPPKPARPLVGDVLRVRR